MNCFPGLGAQIPPNTAEPAATGQSLEQCQALCSDTAQCTAIVHGTNQGGGAAGECRLRMEVVESRCYLTDFGYDTYIKMDGSGTPAPAPAPIIPAPLPSGVPHYGTNWKEVVSGSTCPESTPLTAADPASGQEDGQLTCTLSESVVRTFRFPAGIFDIDEQVVVPANTHIEGNANPIDPTDKAREPDLAGQTYFVATKGVTDQGVAYCGNGGNLQQGDAQKLRVGFLLNSNTVVRNFNYQGRDSIRPDDNGSLCGGAVFETPGCVSPGYANGVGKDYANEAGRAVCRDNAGTQNELITGDGRGVENVLIDSVRLNGLFKEHYRDNLFAVESSQIGVWVAQTQDGSATKNVRINNLVCMSNRGDGINFHGNVQDSIAENCHFEDTGDDIYAAWGGYAENHANVVFRNNVGKNPGVLRNYLYGVCVAVYGATDVTITGTRCYDLAAWNPGQFPSGNYGCNWGPNCNSCMTYVHDGYFGAVYPENNTINIYDNEYMDMAGTPILESDRPQTRIDSGNANVVTQAAAEAMVEALV